MRIGIFGGSFNPIQNAHRDLVKRVLKEELVDEVFIVPCGNHVYGKNLVDPEKRIEMIEISFLEEKKAKVSRVEVDSEETSYMITTIRKLKKNFPEDEFFLICGGDVLNDFPTWYKAEEIAKEVKFIIHTRKGIENKENTLMEIEAMLSGETSDISSTQVREKVAREDSINGLVPEEVEEFINKNQLYKI